MTRALDHYAAALDTLREWHGPAHVGPGGVYALTCNRSAKCNPWTVQRIDTRANITRAVLPFPSFEAASRAAAGYAASA